MVVHAYNLSAREVEARQEDHCKFEDSFVDTVSSRPAMLYSKPDSKYLNK